MDKFWNILGIIFALVGLFLLVFYWQGTKEVVGAGFDGLTQTIMSLTGATAPGWTRSTQYPTQPK